MKSWKLMGPWVVSAVKLGASELILSDMMVPPRLSAAWLGVSLEIRVRFETELYTLVSGPENTRSCRLKSFFLIRRRP